jgi:hypothetical protein
MPSLNKRKNNVDTRQRINLQLQRHVYGKAKIGFHNNNKNNLKQSRFYSIIANVDRALLPEFILKNDIDGGALVNWQRTSSSTSNNNNNGISSNNNPITATKPADSVVRTLIRVQTTYEKARQVFDNSKRAGWIPG